MNLTCKERLKNYLTRDGTTLCECVREEAKIQGFSKSQLKQARKELSVKTWHQFDEDGATENWFWYLED